MYGEGSRESLKGSSSQGCGPRGLPRSTATPSAGEAEGGDPQVWSGGRLKREETYVRGQARGAPLLSGLIPSVHRVGWSRGSWGFGSVPLFSFFHRMESSQRKQTKRLYSSTGTAGGTVASELTLNPGARAGEGMGPFFRGTKQMRLNLLSFRGPSSGRRTISRSHLRSDPPKTEGRSRGVYVPESRSARGARKPWRRGALLGRAAKGAGPGSCHGTSDGP